MYLLDTEVVLRLRTARTADADRPLGAWAAGVHRQSLFISAIALIELERAGLQAERRTKGGGGGWRSWIDDQVMPAFESRILAINGTISIRAAGLPYASIRDALVAATALNDNLTLVTGRPSAFRAGKVKVLDPWSYSDTEAEPDWRHAARGSSQWLKTLFVRG